MSDPAPGHKEHRECGHQVSDVRSGPGLPPGASQSARARSSLALAAAAALQQHQQQHARHRARRSRAARRSYAEAPSTPPNYIFPFASSVYASNTNIFDLDWLMYRPLYWFGNGAQPTVNNSLSLANPPTFNGTKVTITLKHYMWSNGTPVTART